MALEEVLFYGGLAAFGGALLLLLILTPIFRARRKKLVARIEKGDVE